ncbi:MAG: PIG-L family deacetylase [Candidatus Dormibacteraeota bacterium]|nr:PIG-L family deacetylase [Candidatus Dormibacteraeota bacterium]
MNDAVRGVLIVSPHLDDAALSASHRLRAGGAVVVTVCAGLPSSDAPLGWWDRLSGASSARGRQQERIAEDVAAMRFARATGVRLEHLDGQHRNGAALDVDAVAADLHMLISAASEVWLPAGIGHDDHQATREAGMLAARRHRHTAAVLYADVPHALTYGWPSSVTGERVEHLDVDAWLDHELQQTGLDPARLTAQVVHLDAAGREFKEKLLAHYATQLTVLRLDDRSLARDPSLLAHELAGRWEL